MSTRPPLKLTNDTGLGHVIDAHYYLDNRKKVNTNQPAITNYMSKVSRDDTYSNKVAGRSNF